MARTGTVAWIMARTEAVAMTGIMTLTMAVAGTEAVAVTGIVTLTMAVAGTEAVAVTGIVTLTMAVAGTVAIIIPRAIIVVIAGTITVIVSGAVAVIISTRTLTTRTDIPHIIMLLIVYSGTAGTRDRAVMSGSSYGGIFALGMCALWTTDTRTPLSATRGRLLVTLACSLMALCLHRSYREKRKKK